MDEYKDKFKVAYEESIRAYQSHVQRYNTWMNMYAIMTGALFVAFYSVYSNENCDMRWLCVKSLETNVGGVLLVLIALLGFLCSLCWLGAVKGHYEWMKSYVKILKSNERKYFDSYGLFVYTKVAASKRLISSTGNYLFGFYSTQKITLFFIKCIALAWLFCAVFFISQEIAVAVGGVGVLGILFVIHSFLHRDKCCLKKLKFCGLFHSTISSNDVVYIRCKNLFEGR